MRPFFKANSTARMPRPQASTSPQRKKALAIAKELNLNRKTVQRVLRKYAEAIAAEDPDEALLEALAETPKDATSIANTLKNECI